jgi:hypothetical protein
MNNAPEPPPIFTHIWPAASLLWHPARPAASFAEIFLTSTVSRALSEAERLLSQHIQIRGFTIQRTLALPIVSATLHKEGFRFHSSTIGYGQLSRASTPGLKRMSKHPAVIVPLHCQSPEGRRSVEHVRSPPHQIVRACRPTSRLSAGREFESP